MTLDTRLENSLFLSIFSDTDNACKKAQILLSASCELTFFVDNTHVGSEDGFIIRIVRPSR